MTPASDATVVLCTCPGEATAGRIALALIRSGVASCVTRIPGRSTDRWDGQTLDEPQIVLMIKTFDVPLP